MTPRSPEEQRSLGRGYRPRTYIGVLIFLAVAIFVIWWIVLPFFFVPEDAPGARQGLLTPALAAVYRA